MSEEGGGGGGAAVVEEGDAPGGEPPLGGASGHPHHPPTYTCGEEEEKEEEEGPPAEEDQEEESRGGDGSPFNKRHDGGEDCSIEDGATALPSGESGKTQRRASHSNCSSEEGAAAAPGGGSVKAQQQATHSNCSSDNCSPTPSCRICFQGAEQGELLNPCRCDGSVRYTHQTCLLKWISERGCWTCELCCYRFHVLPINMKTPWQWQAINMTLVEKVQIVAVVLGSVFLVSSISWLLWSALSPQAVWQRRDVLFQICYAMYGFMDLVCVGLIVHEGAAVHNVFMRWRAVNLHWDVQSYDKAADMEETATDERHRTLVPPRTLWLPLVTLGPDGRPSHPPTQLSGGPHVPWTSWLCFPCPSLVPAGDGLVPDSASGEVVIRVTSV